jgi:two-component system, NarL family, response regulator DevR
MAATRIRVLLCDDHELVRRGLHALLDADLTLDVVGEASFADEAVEMAATLTPDIVVMDVRMPGRSGIEACRDIRSAREETRVLMLTSFADDEALFTSIMAGASGYVLKNVRGNELVEGIHQVAQGRSLLDPSVTTRVLARLRGDLTPAAGEAGSDLTGQERKVLNLVAEGLTNRQIGERVHLAEKTVKNYVSNILMKLGLARRAEVATFMAKRRRAPEAGDTSWS